MDGAVRLARGGGDRRGDGGAALGVGLAHDGDDSRPDRGAARGAAAAAASAAARTAATSRIVAGRSMRPRQAGAGRRRQAAGGGAGQKPTWSNERAALSVTTAWPFWTAMIARLRCATPLAVRRKGPLAPAKPAPWVSRAVENGLPPWARASAMSAPTAAIASKARPASSCGASP